MLNTTDSKMDPFNLIRKAYKKIPQDFYFALFVTFAIGLSAHLFVYMNALFMGDGIFYVSEYTNGLASNRWFAVLLSSLFGYLTLGWAVGILELILISGAVFVLYRFFSIKTAVGRILVSAIIVTFPTITANHAYLSSAHAYAFALLSSVLAAHLASNMKNRIVAFIISVVLIVLSLSTYQAYICCSLALMLLYLLMQLFIQGSSFKEVFLKGLYFLGIILVAGFLYYLIFLLVTPKSNVESVSRGLDATSFMTRSLSTHAEQLIRSMTYVVRFYLFKGTRSYIPQSSTFAFWVIVPISFLTFLAVAIKKRNMAFWRIVMGGFVFALLLISINLFRFLLQPPTYPHVLMYFSFAIPIVFSVYLLELLREEHFGSIISSIKVGSSWLLITALLVVSFNQWMLAHTAYANMNKAYNEALLRANRITYAIESTEGYTTETEIIYIGYIGYHNWESNNKGFETLENMVAAGAPLSFYGYGTSCYLDWFMEEQLNNKFYKISENDVRYEMFLENEIVKQMPIYPNEGCVKKVDDVIVVKFSD